MRVHLVSHPLETQYRADYYYLFTRLAQKVELTCVPHMDSQRKLIPIDSHRDLLWRGNWWLGKKWHKFRARLGARHELKRISDKIQEDSPDVTLVHGTFSAFGRDCSFIKGRKALLVADFHKPGLLTLVKRSGFDVVIFLYKWWMDRLRDQLDCPVAWLPHSVETDVFKDYGVKTYDVGSSGTLYERVYPFRTLIKSSLSKAQGINFFMPMHARFKGLIREDYARFISQCKIFIFGSSIYNYPIMKYTEGMASGSLVMAPTPKDAEELHFIPSYNFVEAGPRDFLEKIQHYLRQDEERQSIIEEARHTVETYHSTKIRVEQLLDILREVA